AKESLAHVTGYRRAPSSRSLSFSSRQVPPPCANRGESPKKHNHYRKDTQPNKVSNQESSIFFEVGHKTSKFSGRPRQVRFCAILFAARRLPCRCVIPLAYCPFLCSRLYLLYAQSLSRRLKLAQSAASKFMQLK